MHEEEVACRQVAQCSDIDDQLGWTIRCIRAADRLHQNVVAKCIKAYPYLASLIGPKSAELREHGHLQPLRDHALEWLELVYFTI